MKNHKGWHAVMLIFALTGLIGCSVNTSANCNLFCQLNIVQENELTVGEFLEVLRDRKWVTDNITRDLTVMYETDAFSSVLETTLIVPLDIGDSKSQLVLYIGNIGGSYPDYSNIPSELIEGIKIDSELTIFQTLVYYGLPQGGNILPIYMENDLRETNPCPQNSHYIGYYNEGGTIVRATVDRPLLYNLWMTEVEIMYPVGDSLQRSSRWRGRYERMDHRPCLPN